MAGSRAIVGLGSLEVAAETGRKAADSGETGMSVAQGPCGEGTAADGASVLAGIPGTGPLIREGAAADGASVLARIPGTPPTHIMVLAGEAGLRAPGPLNMEAAVTIGRPHAWHTVTGCVAPGVVAGSGAWQ
jgi:hypothetical protein